MELWTILPMSPHREVHQLWTATEEVAVTGEETEAGFSMSLRCQWLLTCLLVNPMTHEPIDDIAQLDELNP